MFVDSRERTADETIEAEVCIVGAGAAGIAIARELIDQRLRVVVLESGGFEPEAEEPVEVTVQNNITGFGFLILDGVA